MGINKKIEISDENKEAIKKAIEEEDQEQSDVQAIGFHVSNAEEDDDEGEDI